MSRSERLISAFKVCQGPYPYRDLVKILNDVGYENKSSGSGSGRKFVHAETKHIIRFHEPHPGNEIKPYLVRQIRDALMEQSLL